MASQAKIRRAKPYGLLGVEAEAKVFGFLIECAS